MSAEKDCKRKELTVLIVERDAIAEGRLMNRPLNLDELIVWRNS
jgi:hypothetical protein